MNMQSIMAQAQKMQRDIQNKKNEIDNMEFIGTSEWVEVTFYGNKNLKSVKILKSGSIDEEDKEVLEEMFQIAVKEAFAKIDAETSKKLGQYAGALDGLL